MSINTPQNQPVVQTQGQRPAFAPSYNAVQINLDTPTLNAPQMNPYYYDYPTADGQPYYPPVQQPQPQPKQPEAPADVKVPAPQVEQPEGEKAAPANNSVNLEQVVANLGSADMDKQSLQMEEIAQKGLNNEADVVPYVHEDVFNKLIDIVCVDSSNLAKPTERQYELRAKVAENDNAKAKAEQEGKDPSTVALPNQISAEDEAFARSITPFEQAERNKEYALYTMAILQKTFGDEIEKRSGNVTPLTDLPGAAQVVSELKTNENPAIRTAAVDALRFVQRPEYKDDLNTIYSIAQTDQDETVVAAATDAMNSLNAM